ncbi:hypothetical protein B0H65DRAFT_191811 [Neurospora tetraspora]|uniref:Uncharacterized protein n=1 Tax=Neurospora tetraspora TaxID=94610 RepID=A0AAE0JF95_9PEZI|nr:hypothetical protein B0H65DRAFT_191811 [Neurospora tetraspora]
MCRIPSTGEHCSWECTTVAFSLAFFSHIFFLFFHQDPLLRTTRVAPQGTHSLVFVSYRTSSLPVSKVLRYQNRRIRIYKQKPVDRCRLTNARFGISIFNSRGSRFGCRCRWRCRDLVNSTMDLVQTSSLAHSLPRRLQRSRYVRQPDVLSRRRLASCNVWAVGNGISERKVFLDENCSREWM